jgi:hypothetical protein
MRRLSSTGDLHQTEAAEALAAFSAAVKLARTHMRAVREGVRHYTGRGIVISSSRSIFALSTSSVVSY